MERDFSVIFETLQQASTGHEATAQQEDSSLHATEAEYDEIAELRRAVLEITEPETLSYTIT